MNQRNRVAAWAFFRLCLCASAVFTCASLSSWAAPPIPALKWGSQLSIPPNQYVYDSFSEIEGARMPYVIEALPGGTPKGHPHPGDNCDNNNAYTTTTGIDTGTVCAERKTSFACIIPGLDPPYFITHCEGVEATKVCPAGYQISGNTCTPDGNPDPGKEPSPPPNKPCSGSTPSCTTGNPVNFALGNKFEREIDYVASGPGGLRWERNYSSSDPSRWSALGELWRHTYSRSITVQTNGSAQMATMRRANGAIYRFVLSGGVWAGDADVTDQLTELTDGSGTRTGWRYQDAFAQEIETYDASGNLLSIADRAGLTQTLAYDSAARLHSVSDAFGRQLTLAYDNSDRIVSMTDPAGNVFAYAYGTLNRLISVTYPDATPGNSTDNPKRQYLYENTSFPHALTGIIDENGNRYATFVYDSQGRATQTKHMSTGGVEVGRYSIAYNSASTRTVTDPLGTARTYSLQTVLRVPKNTSSSQPCATCGGSDFSDATYDANGNIAARHDFNGNLTCFSYDLARNLETARVEGLTGASCPGTSVLGVTRTISTQWHALWPIPIAIAEPKRITSFQYDANINLISKSIQATSDTTGATGFSASPVGSPRTWGYTHTDSGTIPGFITRTVVDGPRTDVSDTTTYDYDTATGNLTSVTNALGHVTSFSNFDAHGRPQTITDANGLITTLSYDVRGRLTSRNAGGETTSYTYDAMEQLTRVTLPDGSFIAYHAGLRSHLRIRHAGPADQHGPGQLQPRVVYLRCQRQPHQPADRQHVANLFDRAPMSEFAFQITAEAVQYLREHVLSTSGRPLVLTIVPMVSQGEVLERDVGEMNLSQQELDAMATTFADSLSSPTEYRWVVGAVYKDRLPDGNFQLIDGIECFLPEEVRSVVNGRVLGLEKGELQFSPQLEPPNVSVKP